MKVAPCSQLYDDVSHALFRQTVQKLERKQYEDCKKFEKIEFRDLLNLKLLLNRNKSEKIIDTKKMRLDHIFPTNIIFFIPMNGLEKITKIRSLPLVVRRTIFQN